MVRSQKIITHVIGSNVLDIGCAGHEVKPNSPYWLHGKLLERFPMTDGLDYSNVNIQKMKDLGFENVFYGKVEDFNLDKKYDTIVAEEII